MSWTRHFGGIELINLKARTDRLLQAYDELKKYRVPHLVCRGTPCENGQEGISRTLRSLFDVHVQTFKPLLVFEDDVQMIVDPIDFDSVMDMAMMELPTNWDMLYLGANLPDPKQVTEYSAHLLRTTRALAIHAVAYSHQCMNYILSLPEELPIDLMFANKIHPRGGTFVTYPLLCTQRPGYSNIEKKEVSYTHYIEDRYKIVEDYLGLSKSSLP